MGGVWAKVGEKKERRRKPKSIKKKIFITRMVCIIALLPERKLLLDKRNSVAYNAGYEAKP